MSKTVELKVKVLVPHEDSLPLLLDSLRKLRNDGFTVLRTDVLSIRETDEV